MSNVPQPNFGPTGFTAPTEEAIFAGVTADINAAFGGNLNPDPTTPQGQLATSETAIIGFSYGLFCQMASQFDPAYADGRMQDALARIYFLERNPSQPTVVQATCSGAAGTPIPAGALARDVDGNVYSCAGSFVIGAGGSVVATFANIVYGPIPCAPGSLTEIYQAIPGWDTITNSSEGVIGNDTETREAFEQRRQASVAINAIGTINAIKANVLNVKNVLDCYVIDNPTSGSVTNGDVTLAPHSLYVAAAGGDPAAIAEAIWLKKMPGAAMTGSTSVTVYDSNNGYSIPYPSYTIKFTEAAALPIYFAVTIAASTAIPSDATTQIQNAIIAAFAGADGGPRAKIGATLFASRFYAPVALLGSWAQIVSLLIGVTSSPVSNDLTVGIDQIPTIIAADIAVTTV